MYVCVYLSTKCKEIDSHVQHHVTHLLSPGPGLLFRSFRLRCQNTVPKHSRRGDMLQNWMLGPVLGKTHNSKPSPTRIALECLTKLQVLWFSKNKGILQVVPPKIPILMLYQDERPSERYTKPEALLK